MAYSYSAPGNPNFVRASVTICWSTNIPTIGRVAYSSEPEYELLGGVVGTPVVDETSATTEHKITLNDLRVDWQYRYYIGTAYDNANPTAGTLILEKSPDHFFRTPPAPGVKKKTKMWVLGDFGAYGANEHNTWQDNVIQGMKNYMASQQTGPMDMWLWLGDNAYEQGRKEQYQDKIFDKVRGRYDWIFRQTPFYGTPGNHDYYDGDYNNGLHHTITRDSIIRVQKKIHYYDVVTNFTNGEGGGEPSGTEEYYSYDYSNIHFISLDTYGLEKKGDDEYTRLAAHTRQYKWLERDLKKAQANPAINWIIVYTHMPPYSGGSHDSNTSIDLIPVRKNLVPLLDKYKVDLVLAGHSHDYQRTRLMRDHYDVSTTFNAATHLPAIGSNARGSGKYDGSTNSCFYYKTSAATQNEGIVYAVAGAGGKPWGNTDSWDQSIVCPTEAYCEDKTIAVRTNQGGSMYIEVENKKLIARYIGTSGQVLDQFVIYKDLESFTIPYSDGTTRTATCECTENVNDVNSFTHYTDNNGNLLLSIKKYGINIGKAGVAPFEVKLGGARGPTNVGAFYPDNYVHGDRTRSFSSGWRVMNRYWTVKPAPELTGNQQVVVRHYYTQDDLNTVRHNPDDNSYDQVYHENLKFYKINSLNTAYTIDPQSGSHNTLPAATTPSKNGIWLYDGFVHNFGSTRSIDDYQATLSEFKWKSGFGDKVFYYTYNNEPYYGEFVISKLAGGGGIGGQVNGVNPQGTKVVLSAGEKWSYFARGSEPANEDVLFSWKGGEYVNGGITYPDVYDQYAKWPTGIAPLGFSPNQSDGERWVIPSCEAELGCYSVNSDKAYVDSDCMTGSCNNRWTTYYFRKVLDSQGWYSSLHKSIIINYKRDDGILIYVNGKEVLPRDPNMPTGTITNSTLAKNAAEERQWNTIIIPNDGTYFRPYYRSTIAVELHQNSLTSSDAIFDMEIILSPDAAPTTARVAALEEEEVHTKELVALYPNPVTNGKVYFSEPVPYETVRITDARGVVLRYLSEPGILKELEISPLPAGTFILSSQYKGKVSHYKIVKNK
ncbi:hypothetical protein GCM10027291_05490 [Telluribacter humicola]